MSQLSCRIAKAGLTRLRPALQGTTQLSYSGRVAVECSLVAPSAGC